MMYVILL